MTNPELEKKRSFVSLFCARLADAYGLWLHPILKCNYEKYAVMIYKLREKEIVVAYADTSNLVEHFDCQMVVVPYMLWHSICLQLCEQFWLKPNTKTVSDIIEKLKKEYDNCDELERCPI